MKKFLKLFTPVFAVIFAFGVFTACDLLPNANDNNTYVAFAINPQIELVVNKNNIVKAVNCANEDAEILLAQTDLIGMTAEAAAERVIELATEAGYIDVEGQDNEVTITVICDNETREEDLRNALKNRLNTYFENNGIFGRVSIETLETFGEEIDALDIPAGKKKMILRALEEDPTLDIETLKDMPINEIIALFRDTISDGLDSGMRAQLKGEAAQIREQFKQEQQRLDEELRNLNEQFKQQREEIRNEQRQEVTERIEQFKQTIEQHRQEIQQNIEQRRQEIQNWRNNR